MFWLVKCRTWCISFVFGFFVSSKTWGTRTVFFFFFLNQHSWGELTKITWLLQNVFGRIAEPTFNLRQFASLSETDSQLNLLIPQNTHTHLKLPASLWLSVHYTQSHSVFHLTRINHQLLIRGQSIVQFTVEHCVFTDSLCSLSSSDRHVDLI